MIVNKQQMDDINKVQMNIFKAFHNVCKALNLTYYLVHGSLLGALRHQGFFPFDDDIDVAMPRKDYEILLKEGQQYLKDNYFIQSYLSEKDYPLNFCKIRDNDTSFIQPVLGGLNVNQGIYIDVFPIDNYPQNKSSQIILKIKEAIYMFRVYSRLSINTHKSYKIKILQIFSKFILPSWYNARNKFATLYNNVPYTGRIIVRGGKSTEVNISSDYFGKAKDITFEDVQSYAPQKTTDYLELIYGDYLNYEPMGKDMVSDNQVKISADIVDVNRSYKNYLKRL